MSWHFSFYHIPALVVGTTMSFGGFWPWFDPRGSMLEFGFPLRIAESPVAAPVWVAGNVRATIIGYLILLFHCRGQMETVDTILASTAVYAGVVDSWVVWRQGNPRAAIFRTASAVLLAAAGLAGWTAHH